MSAGGLRTAGTGLVVVLAMAACGDDDKAAMPTSIRLRPR